jgi:lysophospholipase L1-like esterase
MCVRFVTDAAHIAARWTLRFERLAMEHMPATGVSGLDLYAKQAGLWRWCGSTRPTQSPTNTFNLVCDMKPACRQYMLYLPLYNGIESVEIGLPRGSFVADAPARRGLAARPICFYGTSITQGGCASRPGMVYSAILGRRLDRPIINLGFSGNGQGEPEVATLLAELDPSVYVLDPIANMTVPFVLERLGPMVNQLQLAHRRTPIVLMEHPGFQQPEFVRDKYLEGTSKNMALRKVFKGLKAAGTTGLHYVTSDNLFGSDGEATVDGIHATDLGFLRIADALEPILRPLV